MQQHKLFLPIPQKTKREQKRIGCEKRSSQVPQLGRIRCYIIQRDSLAIFVSSSNTECKNYKVFFVKHFVVKKTTVCRQTMQLNWNICILLKF